MQLVVEDSHDSDLERKGWKDEDEKNSIMSYSNHHIPSIYHFIVRLRELYEKYIADEETITRQTGR